MLSTSAVMGMFVVVMVIRRVGEYALVRPGREMLFTSVPTADKYKAKNFIDTVVYRGADGRQRLDEGGFRYAFEPADGRGRRGGHRFGLGVFGHLYAAPAPAAGRRAGGGMKGA